jgi:hypothetical protein
VLGRPDSQWGYTVLGEVSIEGLWYGLLALEDTTWDLPEATATEVTLRLLLGRLEDQKHDA